MNAIAYAHDQREESLEQLKAFLRIPSVSTTPERRDDVRRAGEWLRAELQRIGLDHAEVIPTGGHPIVYADWLHAEGAPTVLVYGHYDVQPMEPLEEWHSDPFEPTERDGNLYGRGTADDKGQLFVHVKALEALIAADGRLPVNVRCLFEGEEEVSSAHLFPWMAANPERLQADVALISDSHILSVEQPSIVYGLRGIAYMELHVDGPRGDLHSGTYGGAVHNPIQALCELVAQLHDENGTVTVPGFYDRVRPLEDAERSDFARVPYTDETLIHETGVPQPWGEREFTVLERTSARPTLELNGIWGGFQGEGAKTVLPARAGAKFSMRLVPDQDPEEIAALVTAHLQAIAPPTVRVEARLLHTGHGAVVPRDIPAMRAASEAYEEVFGTRPLFVREGGSIPIVAVLQKDFNLHSVLMGFGLPDDNLHAPNEKLSLDMFYKGIETAILFYGKMAGVGRGS